MFDTYVINLDKDIEKWYNIQKKFSWGLTRVPAIDGDDVPDRPFLSTRLIYGCLMSHRKVWETIVQTGRPGLVLEDDCDPLEGFEEKMSSLMKTLPPDYDIALFGYIASDVSCDYFFTLIESVGIKNRGMKKKNADWFVPGYFAGAHCYLISPEGAMKMLEYRKIHHVDSIMNMKHDIVIYCPEKPLASQLHKRTPILLYNDHVAWEWMMFEPSFGLGKFTVRGIHLFILYCLLFFLMIKSNNRFIQVIPIMIVIGSFLHYLYIRIYVYRVKKSQYFNS